MILVSIKQKYVQKILSGDKTIELRKSRPKAKAGDVILIYTTRPVMAVTAIATVGEIITCSPGEMWNSYQTRLGISQSDFFEYYGASKLAIGIELNNVVKLDAEILLSAIKVIYPNFTPPQTFKYINKYSALKNFKVIKDGSMD